MAELPTLKSLEVGRQAKALKPLLDALPRGFYLENGWIKLHRKLLDNPLATKPAWAWLWVVLLLLANHKEGDGFIWNGKPIILKKGQLLTGRKKLRLLTGIPESTIEAILTYLEKTHQIRQQKTTKYRLLTIVKWSDYQKPNNKPTTEEQQTDTFKKVKNEKNKPPTNVELKPTDLEALSRLRSDLLSKKLIK